MGGNNPSILLVGSINMDLVMQTRRAPRTGESSIGQAYSFVPGGKGGNQAVAAARLGAKTTFVGRIGNDAHGTTLKESLTKEGIDQALLFSDGSYQTGFAAIIVEDSGENRIIVYPAANMAIRDEDVVAAFQHPYQAVMLNLETSIETIELVFRLARQKEIPVILDAGPARGYDLQVAKGVEIISPNEVEGEDITGIPCSDEKGAAEAARKLAEITAARHVVMKMGKNGALYYTRESGETELIPGYTVKAVDTTAAGDAFTAGLTVSYLQQGDISRAVRYANAVGALTVTRLGAQPSLPTKAEVERFVQTR